MVYVIAQDEKELHRSAAAAWFMALGGDDEDRAWCPGVSPPDNSCPPSNKGSGGKSASGGGGKKGAGRKSSGRLAPRKPTQRETAIAAREGMSERQIAARRVVAAHFMHNDGSFFNRDTGKLEPLDEKRFRGQMKAIDWTKPVQVGPPPSMPPPQEFVQWQAPGNIPPAGGYFSTTGTQPESLGIGRLGTAWSRRGQPVMRKVPHRFEVRSGSRRRYIRSTAAPANDDWSIKGGRVQRASGGGPQWFVPDAQAAGGVEEFVFRGPRRSSRAFCPGVSPPDNSCSPANKGEGTPREQSLAKKHGLTPRQAKWAAGMIDRLEKKFSGPGRAAAINEVLSAAKYPKYLKGILESTPTASEVESVISWSVRRGRMWEAA